MQSRQANMLRSLRSVEEFLTANATTLNGIVNSGTRRKLASAIAVLETAVREQAGTSASAHGETSRYHALRKALIRDHMTPIARIASAELPAAPDMSALRMPRSGWKMERLAAAARGMGQVAEPLAATFVEAGLAPDFVARLDAASDAMVRSYSERALTRGCLSGATKELAHTLASSRKLVNVIDAFVTTALVHEPGLLRSWKVVKRVRRMPIRAADAPSQTPVVLPADANVPGSALPAPRTASPSAA
jgi:hypothetical protein